MSTTNIEINILYYIEKSEIVVHCPQLAIMGVTRIDQTNMSEDNLAITVFHEKLQQRIGRFTTSVEFFKFLEETGVWNIKENEHIATPMSLNYYLKTLPYLKNIEQKKSSKTLSLQYELPMNGANATA